MNENLDDNGQFKMRLDEEVNDANIPADVDDLRIEKLNHRVTLISILIPVLIVVVLVIAYLDIKKRVIQTEDTGQLTAETLTKDLESRYESITMAQKMIEENINRLKDQSDQSVAKVQINIKKLEDRLKSAGKKMVSQKELKASTDKLGKNVDYVSQTIDELKIQLNQLSENLQPQISALQKSLADNKSEMLKLSDKLSAMEQNKMDKASMELALKLEVLKFKKAYNAQLEELQTRIKSVERKAASPAPRKAPSTITPKSSAPSSSPAPPPTQLEEQTIGR